MAPRKFKKMTAQQFLGAESSPLLSADVYDRSEFPSLGGNAQAQQQNPSFAPGVSPWRTTRSPGSDRRPYAGGIGRGRVRLLRPFFSPALTISQGQPQDETGVGFTPGAEGYRFGGQPTGANQLSGLAQQTGNIPDLASPSTDASQRWPKTSTWHRYNIACETQPSQSSGDVEPISDNPDDVTDEEDWASIGPQALRQGFEAARSGARMDHNLSHPSQQDASGDVTEDMKNSASHFEKPSIWDDASCKMAFTFDLALDKVPRNYSLLPPSLSPLYHNANRASGPSMQSSRLGLTSPAGDQGERTTTSTIGDDRHGGDRGLNTRSTRAVANPFQNQQDQGPIGYQGRAVGPQDQDLTESSSPPQTTNASKQKRLSEMTEEEKWGMPGLLAKILPDSPDFDQLAMGIDISTLGMNLESTE